MTNLETSEPTKETAIMDKTTKALLLLIGIGLCANAITGANADSQEHDYSILLTLRSIDSNIHSLKSDISSLERMARGTCTNDKLC